MSRLPLIAAQPGIWMAEKLLSLSDPALADPALADPALADPALPDLWCVAHYVELYGDLDALLLRDAIAQGIRQTDTPRMRFSDVQGEIWQEVDDGQPLPLPDIVDLRDEADSCHIARHRMHTYTVQPLRAQGDAPLAFHQLIRVGDQHWYWYQRYHHLVVDAFSFLAISRQIVAIYNAWHRHAPAPESMFTPFADVVSEYQRYQQSAAYLRDRQFWAEQCRQLPPPASLSGAIISAKLSAEFSAKTHPAHHVTANLTTDIARITTTLNGSALRQLAHATPDCQPADLALALLALWFGKLCAQPAYAAGFIFMRRLGSAALCATGPVLNVLPLAVQLSHTETLAALAMRLADQIKLMRRHQRYDAEQIARDSGHLAAGKRLFGPVFNIRAFDYQLNMDGVSALTHTLTSGPVHDLEIALFTANETAFTVEILADRQRYDVALLHRHVARLEHMLAQFAADADMRCADVDLLSPGEHQQLATINHTQMPLPETTLSDLVARQAEKTPDAPALEDAVWQFSYRQLRNQTIALAQVLRGRGVKPGDCVAVALPRSALLTLALHAIVEAGAAWLPLDTSYPDERLNMMLEDARPVLLITCETQQHRFPAMASLCYSQPLPAPDAPALALSRPQHTAYVLFTSGSTGRPKGVMVGQRAVVNRLLWMQDHYPLTASDVVAQKTPCSFDVSVWEFWWPLITGAKLVMAEPDIHRDAHRLRDFFARYRVTITHFVPSMLAAFTESLTAENLHQCASLRQVFCSGEALPVRLCRAWQTLTGITLHNLYGPTEAAIDISWYPASGDALAAVRGDSVPIGYPLWNCGLRILDAMLRPLPLYVPGDLYLTGIQLAQGYINRPYLTASRFIADPFAPGQRMYRSGDIARWLDNGAVEYLGRSDDQIKLRGQRIELREIERAMLALPDVAQALVHASVLHEEAAGGDNRQLAGYVVSASGQPLDTQTLLAQLGERLPPFMLPVALMQLNQLPLTANGKLDRNALPVPTLRHANTGHPPASDTEILVAQAFSRLLGGEITDISADFFALGGHSLLAMRLAAMLSQQSGKTVTIGQIMLNSTVSKLSTLLASATADETACHSGFATLLPLRNASGPTLFCFHPASGFAWQFSVLARYLPAHWSIIGIQSPRPGGAMATAATLDEVCDQHLATLLAQQPHEPYFLLGYSLGGTLAQGVAARLRAAGASVAFLGLLDTWPPETQHWADKQNADPAVLAEIARERGAFLAAQGEQSTRDLFAAIEGNYADAVRLLATAHSTYFAGKATLFVAQRTLAEGMHPHTAWAPWIAETELHYQDCSHVDIISPASLATLGPLIAAILQQRSGAAH